MTFFIIKTREEKQVAFWYDREKESTVYRAAKALNAQVEVCPVMTLSQLKRMGGHVVQVGIKNPILVNYPRLC
jgi:hypothetical protein